MPMRRSLRSLTRLTLVLLIGLAASPIVSAGTVPLTVTAPLPAAWPLATGVPFPRGAVTALSALRLEDSAGREVPAQFESLATWPDGSHKSVLVVVTAPPSSAPLVYTLRYGSGVTRAVYTTPLAVTEDATAITVTTGPIRFRLSKTSFTVFNQVWADLDHNGTYDPAEQLLTRPGDLVFVNAFDRLDYRASRYPTPAYTIEERGPMRVVIRATGNLQAANGQTLTTFIVRLTAYAGMDHVAIDYTLVDPRTESDVNATRAQLALAAIEYGLVLPASLTQPVYRFGGQSGVLTGPVTGEHYLFQHGTLDYRNGTMGGFTFAYDGVGTGEKAPGWMDLADARAGIGVMVRDFWQQFPKELAIRNGEIVVSLHPARASAPAPDLEYPSLDTATKRYTRPNTFYFPREGGAKTYQLLVTFHPGADTGSAAALNAVFQAQPRLIAPAAWYGSSQVFGDLLEAGPWSAGYDRYLIDGIYTRSVEEVKDSGGLAMLYGWRDFGDRMRPGWVDTYSGVPIPGFYNDTHVGAHIFFIQYLRTLDPRWWEMGERASRHWMDVDVSHANRWGYWQQNGRAVSFGPGEGHLIKHDVVDHSCRNLHLGHAHLSGLPDYYLLTGDRRALDVIHEVGDWWANAAPVLFPTPVSNPHWAEAERDYAWPLFVMNEAYRATGDPKYFQAATQLVRHLLGWWQTPSNHYVNGVVVGRNDWAAGTGWWYMYPRQDNSPSPTCDSRGCQVQFNGTNPWMAGALISSVIQYKGFNDDQRAVDATLLTQMLLQTMHYVVKYGWETALKDYPYFIYSEASRDTDGGSNHLLTPLAYLYTLYQADKSNQPTGWYSTMPQWKTIAQTEYDDWGVERWRGSTALGFYGYEMIHPADFWSIMRRMGPIVEPANAPPQLDALTNQTVSEGVPLSFTVTATDPNPGVLVYSSSTLPTGAAWDPLTHAFSWTPGFHQAGAYPITFTVTDPTGLSDSITITITVQDVNRPPVLTIPGDRTVTAGTLMTMTISAADPDGDALTFSATSAGGLPSGAAFAPAALTLTWTPGMNQMGDHVISFTANDGHAQDLKSLTVTVIGQAVPNQAPVLDPVDEQTVDEGQPLTFTIAGSDPDGDAVILTLAPVPAGAAFDAGTGLFSWTPSFTQAGEYTLTATASDGVLTATRPVVIHVRPVNRPPAMDTPAERTITPQQLLQVLFAATDPDGDALSWSGAPLPTGAVVDASAGTFTWTPSPDQVGDYEIDVTVSDGHAAASQPLAIHVLAEAPNQPPAIQAIADPTVAEGAALALTLTVDDPDGESVAVSIDPLPEGAHFDRATRTLTWTPDYTQAGVYPLTVTAADGITSTQTTFTITVTNTNRSPVLPALNPRTMLETESLAITLTAQDPDGDPLTYTAKNLPKGATFDPATASFLWVPMTSQAGRYTISFTVTDGTATVSRDLLVTVQQKSRVIAGTIRTTSGAPAANVQVQIFKTNGSRLLKTAKTDGTGRYWVEGLPLVAGYDIKPVASATAQYSPSSRKVDLLSVDALKQDFVQSPMPKPPTVKAATAAPLIGTAH